MQIPVKFLILLKVVGVVLGSQSILIDKDSYEWRNNDENNVVCPISKLIQGNVSINGFDPVRRYTEISGLAFSSIQVSPSTGNPIMYVINDGGGNEGGRIGVYDSGT